MYVGSDFDILDPDEQDFFTFDFVRDMLVGETIASYTFTLEAMTEFGPDDPLVATRLLGSPSITGTKISQTVGNCIADVYYRLTVFVTTSNAREIKRWSHFWCRTPS